MANFNALREQIINEEEQLIGHKLPDIFWGGKEDGEFGNLFSDNYEDFLIHHYLYRIWFNREIVPTIEHGAYTGYEILPKGATW